MLNKFGCFNVSWPTFGIRYSVQKTKTEKKVGINESETRNLNLNLSIDRSIKIDLKISDVMIIFCGLFYHTF